MEYPKRRKSKSAHAERLIEIPPGALSPFVPAWLRDVVRYLDDAELRVLLVYVSRANDKGEAWPSIESLQLDTGRGKNAVEIARPSLVAKKLLVEVRQERKNGSFGRKIFKLGWKL